MKKIVLLSASTFIAGIAHGQTVIDVTTDFSAYSEHNTTGGIAVANAGNFYGTTGVGVVTGTGSVRTGREASTPNQLHRGFLVFDLDDGLSSAEIASATLEIDGFQFTVPGSTGVTLYHSAEYNDLTQAASAFEDSTFTDTVATISGTGTAVFDVTALIKANYDEDSGNIVASFKTQVTNESGLFATASGGSAQRLLLRSLEGATGSHAKLTITTVAIPEPSTYGVALGAVALVGLWIRRLGKRHRQ